MGRRKDLSVDIVQQGFRGAKGHLFPVPGWRGIVRDPLDTGHGRGEDGRILPLQIAAPSTWEIPSRNSHLPVWDIRQTRDSH